MKEYVVTLTVEELQGRSDLIAAGKAAAPKLAHVRILPGVWKFEPHCSLLRA